MARGIIKIKDKYFEWSTVVDAPITYGMNLEQLNEYIKSEYGEEGLRNLPRRLESVEEVGSSFMGDTLYGTICANRAGDDETTLTEDEIYEKYKSS